MNRKQYLIILLLFIFSMTGFNFIYAASPASPLEKPNGKSILNTISYFTQKIRNRPAGSEQAATTAIYIGEQLKSSGYHLMLQDYRLPNNHTARNIQVFYAGATTQKELFILSHYDSMNPALDSINSAGPTAVMLELAQLLKGKTLPHSVNFIFLGADDSPDSGDISGRQGLAKFLSHQKNLGLDLIGGMIDLTSVGASNRIKITYFGDTTLPWVQKLKPVISGNSNSLEFTVNNPAPDELRELADKWISIEQLSDTPTSSSNKKRIPTKINQGDLEEITGYLYNLIMNFP